MNKSSPSIDPNKVTKPIQLLAAWLAGLILVNSGFLVAAIQIEPQHWTSKILVVAAVINVPLFLTAIFVLQTKYRPELQEDVFYSEYLDKNSNKIISVPKDSSGTSAIADKLDVMQRSISTLLDERSNITSENLHPWGGWKLSVNDLHPNLNAVRSALNEAGIPIHDYFGSSSLSQEKPKRFIIGFRETADIGTCIRVLKSVSDLGFEGYYYFDDIQEEPDDIYLGSYHNKEQIIPINQELTQLLAKPNLNSKEVRMFESQYA